MEPSVNSDEREDRLENSATTTISINLSGDESSLTPRDTDLIGSFEVTSSSDEPLNNEDCVDSVETELDKSLTLVACRPVLNSGKEVVSDDDAIIKAQKECREVKNIQKTKHTVQNVDELATIDEENPVVRYEDIVIIPTDQELSVDNRHDSQETSDNKQIIIKPRASEKGNSSNNNGLKSPRKLCEPVVELEAESGDNEAVKRNNRVESGHRRVSVTSPPAIGISKANTGPVPVGSNKECRRHSTGEVVAKNKSPLSLDGLARGTQSGRMDAEVTPINHKENRLPTIINTDDRTSNNKKCSRRNSGGGGSARNVNVASSSNSNVRVNPTRCHSSHGERERSTKFQYTRNNGISRSYDKSVNILGSQNSLASNSSERQRPGSVFEQRYTTRELRRALPRRSFFSCHEKAMKDAGFETDDPEKKRKAERLKARLEKIANEYSPLPSARNKPDMQETQGLVNGVVNITINDGHGFESEIIDNDIKLEESDSLISNMNSDIGADISDTREASSLKHGTSKLLVKTTHKKRPGSGRQEHIDCKPLLQYLEYVKDNREEYLHHNHTHASHSTKSNPTSRLISLGKAFELRHLGGTPRRHDDDIVVMAAKALRPRCSDPAKYTKIERDKSGTHRGQDSLRQARPSSEDKRKHEAHHAKEEEHAKTKTELEKKRIRAEEWTKSVSTNTLTKAKIQSLRELGADDVEIMKWWDAFKSCRYLRDTGPV